MNSTFTSVNLTQLNGTVETIVEAATCDKLKFVFAFVIIGSICVLGMIGNLLSLIVLSKIKVSNKLVNCYKLYP